MDDHPISRVEWVDRDLLDANAWNPNNMAPPEMDLLKLSIVEDGWTTALVVQPKDGGRYEIVDGFHRWLAAGDPAVAELTGGKVPVVTVELDDADARIATIRHNRARGQHALRLMADIVNDLDAGYGLGEDEIVARLGMEKEEFRRLIDRGDMLERVAGNMMGAAWRPAPKEDQE